MGKNSVSMRSLIRSGFGFSVGLFLAQMIFVLIGMLLFVPGYILYTRASEKKSGSKVGGLVLMGLGVAIMGGIGFGILLDSAGDMFE
jgi:hypothetical protein